MLLHPNKLIIFDLDGVLLDARELHYQAFINAVKTYCPYVNISSEEHIALYDGLPTKRKLEILSEKGIVPKEFHEKIAEEKQRLTIMFLSDNVIPSKFLSDLFDRIHEQGYKIAVCSNSIHKTISMALRSIGLLEASNDPLHPAHIDYVVSNEHVKRPKPAPDMYWAAMLHLNAIPSTTIILEDSHIGRQAVRESGCRLVPVTENCVIPIAELFKAMQEVDEGLIVRPNIPWTDHNLNVMIPMAGAGTRFSQAGYTFPKPLIEVHGKPMIQVVVENLNMPNARHIFAVQKEHLDKYNLEPFLKLLRPNCTIVPFEGVTQGAAETVLTSLRWDSLLNDKHPLIIANSDQFVEWNVNETMYSFSQPGIDGGIVTFEATHPKWSYVGLDESGFVNEVAEKRVISTHATCGIYYWRETSNFMINAVKMMDKNIRVNNEFYVAPVFNEAIGEGAKIKRKEADKMWGLGTPEDLNYFLQNYKGKV
jgi:HAD superfamily hydrolase (TIGR01509 family)